MHPPATAGPLTIPILHITHPFVFTCAILPLAPYGDIRMIVSNQYRLK